MSKIVIGILTGILIFIAAGILATYWVEKMRREMEQKRPRIAMTVKRGASFRVVSEMCVKAIAAHRIQREV